MKLGTNIIPLVTVIYFHFLISDINNASMTSMRTQEVIQWITITGIIMKLQFLLVSRINALEGK
jgi:hypothetical protein